jgi:hypothetical protein
VPCFHPLTAFRVFGEKKIVFREKRGVDTTEQLSLPCGQCVGCRLERSRQWAMRCLHEASLYEHNSFITLTYDDSHLPTNNSLDYEDFQLFMKRLRKNHQGLQCVPTSTNPYPIRFYMCGEYGEQFGRPHFHALLFNFDFRDKYYWGRTASKSKIYRSKILEDLWPFGHSSIGSVNFESSAYVARYIMKKVNGQLAASHYESVNPVTGELFKKTPEFNKMSRSGGIGINWYDKHKSDVYPHDYVIVNGKKCKPPRYYDTKYKQSNPFEFDELQFKRLQEAKLRFSDNNEERLLVKEKVTLAKLNQLPRKLK